MKIIYLYIKESPKGLKYLGVTTKDPYKYLGSGKYWRRHLNKYKFQANNIKTNILLQTKDNDIIKFFGLYYSKIYNVVKSKEWANLIPESGEFSCLGAKASIETRLKLSKAKKGHKYRLGHKASLETRKLMSDNRKGDKNSFFNKKHKEESKNKIGLKNKNKKMSVEERINLTEIVKKPIIQYDLNGGFIKEWECSRYAANKLNLHSTNITRCCKEKAKSTGGFIWKYK